MNNKDVTDPLHINDENNVKNDKKYGTTTRLRL